MKQEEKELLLRDLSARLPYGVKLGFYASATNQTHICTLLGIEPDNDEPVIAKTENGSFYMLADHIKPYLFPLSSMTEGQKNLFSLIVCNLNDSDMWRDGDMIFIDNETDLDGLLDFYNKNHLDWRGLIPLGLAIDATDKNIY